MSNVLDDEKQRQICALGRLGWTLSRIQEATGSRRDRISGYLNSPGSPSYLHGHSGIHVALQCMHL